MEEKFDVIVFATGYKSVANKWLKVYVINIHLTFHIICSIFFISRALSNCKLIDYYLIYVSFEGLQICS
jgi:hypothetical protein